MKKIRTLIVDDEPLARERLAALLAGEGDIEIVAQCRDGEEAVTAIVDHEPDLVFLDVQMPQMNGFEVIEACRLFHLAPAKVEVIVHPQSTIHSMVEFVDGSILAQFSVTDMRLPILYALTYPERIPSDLRFPVMNLRHLEFCPPDMEKFPCLRLAYEAAEAGGAKTIALNAADEVAVAAFLDGCIGFDAIPRVIESVISATKTGKLESIREVLGADAEARRAAGEQVERLSRSSSPIPRAASIMSHRE